MQIEGFHGAKLELDAAADAWASERGTAIIFPGGGYSWLSDRESEPVAKAFRRYGYRAAILRYDVASDVLGLTPIRQAAWAVGKIRELYQGEPVYLVGFSAGAHCAASLGVHWDNTDWVGAPLFDEVRRYLADHRDGGEVDFLRDSTLFCADRLILSYPVITSGKYAHCGSFERLLGANMQDTETYLRALRWFSLETQVTDRMPATFLWQTVADNEVPVQNAMLFAESLISAGVPVELHIYPKGVHGLSLATKEVEQPEKQRLPDSHIAEWFPTMIEWLKYEL